MGSLFGFDVNGQIEGGNAPSNPFENIKPVKPEELPQVKLRLEIPKKLLFLITRKARFKVAYGGRGSAKSWSFARALIAKAVTERPLIRNAQGKMVEGHHLILCAREYQNSIQDSVHRILSNQIHAMGLSEYFDIQKQTIRCLSTGAEFIFKGLHHSINEIKSTEGITICWVEEAQAVSADSWGILIPTIRGMEGAEIWVSYNPYLESDPTSILFQGTDPKHPVDPRAIVVPVNWDDNKWFPKDMEQDRQILLRQDPEAYEHVYNGAFLSISEATIFRNRYEVRPFETPPSVKRFFYGVDWGFADDPTFATRAWIDEDTNTLYVDYEAYGVHVEIDDIPALLAGGRAVKNGCDFPGIPNIKDWPLKADNSQPMVISYMLRQGFNIAGAAKWPGSVEDGVQHLKGFAKIVIHEHRCPRLAQEARLYKYKVDKQTGDILPVIVDKHNHGWDSLRYSLDGYIQQRGGLGVWRKLAGL